MTKEEKIREAYKFDPCRWSIDVLAWEEANLPYRVADRKATTRTTSSLGWGKKP